jgi:DNA-binding XRE family transcriptional regulator
MQINRLRVRRAELDITQGKAAKAAGLARYRFWQIENEEGPVPTPAERKAIAKALKVKSADDLFPEQVGA